MRRSAEANPGRPIPPGMPAFKDENMIMLSAIAGRGAGDGAALRCAAQNFHAAMAQNQASGRGVAACGRGARAVRRVGHPPSAARETFAAMDAVLSGAAARYTDYEGGAQAVMAADTLLNSLVRKGRDRAAANASGRHQPRFRPSA